jgi:tetratricopeptide (TPR) repeat protein
MTMLPPKEVPTGLSDQEYQILLFRYQFLVWPRQMATCSKILMKNDAVGQNMTDEGRKRMTVLITALEATFFVNDAYEAVQHTASDMVKLAASEVGGAMDKNPTTAKVKKNMMLMAGMAKSLADGALHKVVSDVVMPTVGLPVDSVPTGHSAEHYLAMANRYEQFGFAEAARMALERAIEVDSKALNANKARVRIKTRLPLNPVPEAATKLYVQGLKNYVIKDYEGARDVFEQCLRDYPDFEWPAVMLGKTLIYMGDLERAQDLALKVYRANPNMIRAHLLLASIDVAAWRIKLLEERLEKVRALDSGTPELAPFDSLMQHLIGSGIYRPTG